MQRARRIEEGGFEAIWLAEHHFTTYSVCPSIHLMGAHLAAHTTTLRIGMGVSIAAFYHPLRLAEEVAMLDVLSGGRVDWGAGRGFDPDEFATFGVPMAESRRRFHEAVEIVRAAWRPGPLTHSGEFWSFDGIEVLPKPTQRPHPPIWLAAGSDGAVEWSGRAGYDILLGPHATFDELARHRSMYARALASGGHDTDRVVPTVRLLAVDDDDAAAAEVARRGANWLVDEYMNPSKATRPDRADQQILTLDRRRKLDRYLDAGAIHGSPAKVLDQLLWLREVHDLRYLLVAPLSERSLRLFVDEVMPRLPA